jgi:hypothetical protein
MKNEWMRYQTNEWVVRWISGRWLQWSKFSLGRRSWGSAQKHISCFLQGWAPRNWRHPCRGKPSVRGSQKDSELAEVAGAVLWAHPHHWLAVWPQVELRESTSSLWASNFPSLKWRQVPILEPFANIRKTGYLILKVGDLIPIPSTVDHEESSYVALSRGRCREKCDKWEMVGEKPSVRISWQEYKKCETLVWATVVWEGFLEEGHYDGSKEWVGFRY